MEIEIKYLDDCLKEFCFAVDYKTNGAAAIDLRAAIPKEIRILPQGYTMIPTGLAVHMEATDMAALLLPRSGIAVNKGLILANSIGLIDSDYQQEIMIAALNRNFYEEVIIEPYERIAQLMFIPVIRARFKEVNEFSTLNTRGGFGSTGSK